MIASTHVHAALSSSIASEGGVSRLGRYLPCSVLCPLQFRSFGFA